jgi:uncharacterized protein YdaU (DUF1376 family)
MSDKRPTLPWFRFFYRDFLTATIGWSPAERGAYLVLICAQWESGALDRDTKILASIAGTTPEEMALLWKRVGRKFRDTPEGLLNERTEKERAEAVETMESRQRGAAKARAKKRPSNVVPISGAKDGR